MGNFVHVVVWLCEVSYQVVKICVLGGFIRI